MPISTPDTTPKLTTSQHWPATILACVLIAALAVIYAVSSPDQRSQLLLGAGALGVMVQGFMPAFRRLAGVTVIGLALLLSQASGCGASPAAIPVFVTGAQIVLAATCTGADKLCEANDPQCGSGACHVAHDVCETLSPSSPVELSCSAAPPVMPPAVSTTLPLPQVQLVDQVTDRRPRRDHTRVRL